MGNLTERKCVACRVGATQATDAETAEFMREIPDWELIEVDQVKRLTKSFTFKNFVDALAFTNKVGVLAEAEDHHPALLTEWGRVKVSWWTHKIKGLHVNDFVMAAKTDQLVTG